MHPNKLATHTIQSSLRHPDEKVEDVPFMLAALGRLWQGNTQFESGGLFNEQGRKRVSIPTYAFDHVRHWVEPGKPLQSGGLVRREELGQWLYQPVWQRLSTLKLPADLSGKKVLLLAGSHSLNQDLVKTLEGVGANVVEVHIGDSLQLSATPFTLRVNRGDDYVRLIDTLRASEEKIDGVMHTLALDLTTSNSLENVAPQRPLVFDSLLYLAQAFGNEDWDYNQRWLILSAGCQQVAGESLGSPLQALLTGPASVIPHEMTHIDCTSVDLSLDQVAAPYPGLAEQVLAQLLGDNGSGGEHRQIALRGAARLVKSYQQIPAAELKPDDKNNNDLDKIADLTPIREQGVYLITGGTGGLGLVAAETLAQQAKVRLALVARRGLPERQYWQALIDQQAAEASVLSRILGLEALGSQVLILSGDVTDLADMELIVEKVEKQWGEVHGVIHTAGVIDDELIQLKDIDQALSVLAPKVEGTLVLQKLFDIKALDFLALYSSTSAFSGLPGQIDYAAANAFLDCFAYSADSDNVVSINWPAWKDAGMAVSMTDGSGQRYQPPGRPVEHTLLDRCIQEDEKQSIYSTVFDVDSYWLLSEHRIKDGAALIPGSGFVELARAAFTDARGVGSVELQDVVLEVPFFVSDHEYKVLRVNLTYSQAGANFTITSESDGEWIEHVRGKVRHSEIAKESLDLQSLLVSCQKGEQSFLDEDHHPYLDFGPRWDVIKKISYGKNVACIEIQVSDTYCGELQTLPLHPAILDMATAGAQIIIPDYQAQDELYVPVSYGRLKFLGELPQELFSHVVYKPSESGEHDHDIAKFDIRVSDSSGKVLLLVDDFTMQRITDVSALKRMVNNAVSEINQTLQRTLELGIDREEGGNALLHILQKQLTPQAVVSAYDLGSLQAELLSPYLEVHTDQAEISHDADSDSEISQIELALLANEAIESIVVRAHLDEAGERRLIAHYVPDFDHHITVSELRRFAKENLAANCIPQQFIELDDMPVNDKGEVDRKVLADPFALEDNYIPPRTSTERGLAKIWQDALGIDKVGLNENFFDVGGHSLLSIRVIIRADKKFGVRLDQATMVLHTLEQIASEVDERLGVSHEEEVVAGSDLKAAKKDAVEPKGLMKKFFGRK